MAGRLMGDSVVSISDKPRTKKKELTCVSIKPAENGFIVTKTYEVPGRDYSRYENEDAVFETKERMDTFVDRIFGIKD